MLGETSHAGCVSHSVGSEGEGLCSGGLFQVRLVVLLGAGAAVAEMNGRERSAGRGFYHIGARLRRAAAPAAALQCPHIDGDGAIALLLRVAEPRGEHADGEEDGG